MKNIFNIVLLFTLTSFSPMLIAGTVTICGSNKIQYRGIPFDITNNEMTIETTINDHYQSQKNITLNTTSCADYAFEGDIAQIKIRERFTGTNDYFNWIDFPLMDIDDKKTIYLCQGLEVAGIADKLIAGVLYANHFGKITFSKSEWDSFNYQCGQTTPNQHWSAL